MMTMLHDLHGKYIQDKKAEHLIVEGDAKLFEILQSLKHEYGDELQWLLPFPGDWHMLKNYQPALFKAYYDAGLKSMAEAAGYLLNQIKSCGQFKRTHMFILEAWEAIYRAMVTSFIEYTHNEHPTTDLQEKICETLESIATSTQKARFRTNFNEKMGKLKGELQHYFSKFKSFIQKMSSIDDIWRLWVQFVFQDAMAYGSLFLAVRGGDWRLRMASIEQMAPVFTVFDHATYQKVISQHIADILVMPDSILTIFQQGAFVVSISGREWYSVAIDEAHEMLINRGCKSSLVKPTPDHIDRMASYLPYRSKVLENLKHEIFPEAKTKGLMTQSPYSKDRLDFKFEQNVRTMIEVTPKTAVFDIVKKNRGLFNPFSNVQATEQQSRDLLNVRTTGLKEYLLRISYYILRQPSTQAPNRKRKLHTLSEFKQVQNKRRVSQLEKDTRLVISAMKKK